jgi:hypothetical protein
VVTGEDDRSFPVALEVARGDLKSSRHIGHRTPWQVLAAFAESGDSSDLDLWHTWERATDRVQAIRWSAGLRAEVALGEEETDEEAVEAVVGGEVVYTFSMEEWRLVCRTRGGKAAVLTQAEEGGTLAVRLYLAALSAGHTVQIAESA